MYDTKAYSAASATSPLARTQIKRRDPADHDVQIQILFCGICHSDLHSVRNEWSSIMPTVYPSPPSPLSWAAAASPDRTSAASPKRRRCSTFAGARHHR